jgi:hypothetical protein
VRAGGAGLGDQASGATVMARRASSAEVTVISTALPAARSARTTGGSGYPEGETDQRDRVRDGQLDLRREVAVVA